MVAEDADHTSRRLWTFVPVVVGLVVVLASGFAGARYYPDIDNLEPTVGGPGEPRCSKGELADAHPCQTDNRDVYYYMDRIQEVQA